MPATGAISVLTSALPYKVDGWGRKVLIQSQYYAGDSGSVSHKNVDQTTAAQAGGEEDGQAPTPGLSNTWTGQVSSPR